jgi:hypothetical protein
MLRITYSVLLIHVCEIVSTLGGVLNQTTRHWDTHAASYEISGGAVRVARVCEVGVHSKPGAKRLHRAARVLILPPCQDTNGGTTDGGPHSAPAYALAKVNAHRVAVLRYRRSQSLRARLRRMFSLPSPVTEYSSACSRGHCQWSTSLRVRIRPLPTNGVVIVRSFRPAAQLERSCYAGRNHTIVPRGAFSFRGPCASFHRFCS